MFRLVLGPITTGILKGPMSPSTIMALISTDIPIQQARFAAALRLRTVLENTKQISKSANRNDAQGPHEPGTSFSTAFLNSGKRASRGPCGT